MAYGLKACSCHPLIADIQPTSGVTGGGGVPPDTSYREIFADVSGKKRQGKQGKWVKIEKERRKIVKGKVENWKWKYEKVQKEARTFFFFFFFFFLKTTEICFGFTRVGIFYRKKKKKSGKMTAPSEKYACNAPAANRPA